MPPSSASALIVDVSRAVSAGKDFLAHENVPHAALNAMTAAASKGYETDYAFLNAPVDTEGIKHALAVKKKLGSVDILVLVGIGGSNLGTLAVAQAIRGSLQHLTTSPALLCADTVDAHAVSDIAATIRAAGKRRQRVAVVIISKSGSTIETLANANIILEALATTGRDWQKRVVVISEDASPLTHAAATAGFITVPHPRRLGGRYSVLSVVGLVPLAILGVAVKKLLAGAAAMRTRCLDASITKNPAAQLALAQYHALANGKNITEYFVFGSDLEGVGRWYRQLLGESCGKDGKGLTPTVAVGSTDLHSIGQLALGGPADKFTIFIESANDVRTVVPKKQVLAVAPSIAGLELATILRAIAEGTRRAYDDAKRPYATITLPQRDAHAIGELLQLHLTQTVFLAALMRVNPFDQPAVESYKEHTRAILAKQK